MYYMERGNGPAVVLLHSYLANAFMWSPQVRAMETNHRVIVPELWGHGSSGHLPQVTSDLSGLANQVGELMEKLELHEYALIGQSVGGMLAGELAAAYPHRITRLVLMATYLGEESAVSRTRFMDLLDRIDARGCIDPPLLEELMPIFFGPYGSAETVALKVSFRRQVSALMAGPTEAEHRSHRPHDLRAPQLTRGPEIHRRRFDDGVMRRARQNTSSGRIHSYGATGGLPIRGGSRRRSYSQSGILGIRHARTRRFHRWALNSQPRLLTSWPNGRTPAPARWPAHARDCWRAVCPSRSTGIPSPFPGIAPGAARSACSTSPRQRRAARRSPAR
ncbi:pimeloyl-ACP methyl ester carboxylesterase [Luteibacter sp. W1I16]